MADIDSHFTLPSPVDTPYRTPSSTRSRQTSRGFEDMSPGTTPPPLPSEERASSRASKQRDLESPRPLDGGLDDTLPLTDPRRFTPTLHASLVSEILALRREVENKTKSIDNLEVTLHTAQSQNDSLNGKLLASNKEIRQIKRQMQILEGGTLSAINDLAKERDEALNDMSELRTRLEQAQKKAKAHEETVDRVQEQWQKDREAWAGERRALETKVHVVEGRLKAVLNEVASSQVPTSEEVVLTPKRSVSRNSVIESPIKYSASAKARRQSTNSVSSDHLGARTSLQALGTVATNLADELADIEEDHHSVADIDEVAMSPDALPEENLARPSSSLSLKARKVLGLPIDFGDLENNDRRGHNCVLTNHSEENNNTHGIQSIYVDTAIQYSRPSSPVKQQRLSTADSIATIKDRSSGDLSRYSNTYSVASPTSQTFSIDTSDANWEAMLRNQPIMVSSSCQTVEQLLSPPLTPKNDLMLATIDESIETREFGVQTDDLSTPKRNSSATLIPVDTVHLVNSSDSTVPHISIIPPSSRPGTPEGVSVQLPPRTKSEGSQVDIRVLNNYSDSSMQTEQIHVDKRNIIPHPHLPPPPPPLTALPPLPPSQLMFNKHKPHNFRRGGQNTANSSMRRAGPNQNSALPPINDDGSLEGGSSADEVPPLRNFGPQAPFDDTIEELDDLTDDDVFGSDDILNRPVAKYVIQRGKLISLEKASSDHLDLESEAAMVGERLALENIRLSEDRDRERSGGRTSPRSRSLKRQPNVKSIKRAAPPPSLSSSSKSANMRRTALISSGAAAHQSKNSQSSLGSTETSRPPPMPIPVRYSSARVGKAMSEGGRNSRASSTASPTKNVRRVAKPGLRKTRSGPALSPAAAAAAQRSRSRSPPLLDPRVSIVPEMPEFQMPSATGDGGSAVTFTRGNSYEASAPRPSMTTGPNRKAPHVQTNSDAVSMQQTTSVVDAIAQTMVGEWMYKYVRRRKSFGKPDKDWDPTQSVDQLVSNTAASGVRHKRWVWLAPYERSVMWSSKQPTDGTALLGKSGRKLTVKSVLDVRDDNPMPKGSISGAHFNRSILILTPQRALKFTATSQERHYMWLTALSFLSHSPVSLNDLAPLPPPPPDTQTHGSISPAPSLGGSFRRRPIRDSIRIAKLSDRRLGVMHSFSTDVSALTSDFDRASTREFYDAVNDAALPPTVKRYHNRNRSNTAPRPVPSTFRSILGRNESYPSAQSSFVNNGYAPSHVPSERSAYTPSFGAPSIPSSRRGSEASAMGRPPLNTMQLMENGSNSSHSASMTMRMDAFIERQGGRAPLKNLQSTTQNNVKAAPQYRKDMSYWGGDYKRQSMSPVDSLVPDSIRLSESTGRGSGDRDYFRGF